MRKVCEVYLVSSSATDERGVELAFPVSQYEMMDAFEQIHTKSPGDVYWQVDEFYCFDYLAPHLDESMSIFEFNSLTEQLSKLDERQADHIGNFPLRFAVRQRLQFLRADNIAVRSEHTGFALAHLFADFCVIQKGIDTVRQGSQLRQEIIVRAEFS